MKVKRVFLKTFGCRTNIYDSAVMAQNIRDFELVDSEEEADIVIVNSCTVTNSADSSARHYIHSLNRQNKKVILAGCGAFSKGESLLKEEKIFGYFGHSEKKNINELLLREERFSEIGDLRSLDEAIVEDFSSKTKAFIKIQEGCDFRCSYCIIPFVRGDARSYDEEKILRQITNLASNGFGEFVLTGTNLGSYGKDTHSSIATLLKRISLIPGVKRIRLGSLEPVQIDDSFKEILTEPWLEKHLHIALQHTSEEMLRIMRRRSFLKEDMTLFEEIAQKGFSLGTDFIVGHPGESERIWQEALENFKTFPITHLHGFTYSKRDGTHAATLKESVNAKVAKERLKVLERIVKENNYQFRQKNTSALLVLVEEQKNGYQIGYDQFYNRLFIESDLELKKEWVHVEKFSVKEEGNYAKI
jgi:MiaB-like tRNA modifying enzyme